jgi:hypothetical protein
VLAVDLVDGSNAVVNDDAGTANTISKALTAVSTAYVTVSGAIRTPSNLPSTLKLRVRLSTALESGKSMYLDDLALVPMVELYTGGPWLAGFRGDTNVLRGDTFAVACTNDGAGVIQTYTEALFGMRNLGLQIPSSGSNTVNENLVA